MKKFISIILAATMLFAVCSFSAFADDRIYFFTEPKDNPYSDSKHYVNDIYGEGFLVFYPSNRYFLYIVSCKNLGYDIYEFHLFAQCAINYSDGSQDFYTVSDQVPITTNEEKLAYEYLYLPSDKTIVSIDAEFFIWYENDAIWEGWIYYPFPSQD